MSIIHHVAIIMDGNGRWAKERHRPRVWGHVRGASKVTPIVDAAVELGLKSLTLYAFSTENWSRPSNEIKTLFHLLKKYLLKEKEKIIKNQLCFKVIGRTDRLHPKTQELIYSLEEETRDAKGMQLLFAFDYGGHEEIIEGCNRFIEQNPGKKIKKDDLRKFLQLPLKVPQIDLLIRTSGEQRISNFLLWHLSYAELYFIETKWPDFSPMLLKEIIEKVALRERRYGDVTASSLEQVEKRGKENISQLV